MSYAMSAFGPKRTFPSCTAHVRFSGVEGDMV
jgi:hypothetical protein